MVHTDVKKKKKPYIWGRSNAKIHSRSYIWMLGTDWLIILPQYLLLQATMIWEAPLCIERCVLLTVALC